MELETALYITTYYNLFFTEQEKIAHRHLMSIVKLEGEPENSPRIKMYKQKGWLTSDKNILCLIKHGESEFLINTAIRILNEHKEKIFLNTCPNCKKLARTPKAKQCRQCGTDWHGK